MAKRRSPRDGAVYRSPDGSGWIAALELPMLGDGRRRRRKRRARTRAEAQQLLRQMKDELAKAGSVSSAQRTVGDAVESFMARRELEALAAGTRDNDRWLAGLIVTGLGRRKLSTLTVADCDHFLATCMAGLGDRRPIGRAHMAKLRQRLAAVLRNEMRHGNLARNVAELAIVPAGHDQGNKDMDEDDGRRSLTVEELHRLLGAATGSRLILIDLCGRNGLRPAEARALRWIDVDLEAGELSVRGQMDRHDRRTNVKKAHNAARTIPLDETTVERLKLWAQEIDEMRTRAGQAWTETGVVAASAFGTVVDRHSFARSLRLLCPKVGIDPSISPYELRHTAISLQADAGRSSWEIADWAGTSEAMVSRIYRHRLRRVSMLGPVAGTQDLP
ncbi:MAG: tyrosine-type recombinase/integrase [Actinomycetota bacterium]